MGQPAIESISTTDFADVRIEIMQALLHNSIVSKDAFDNIAIIFDDIDGENNEAWEDYKSMYGTDIEWTDIESPHLV